MAAKLAAEAAQLEAEAAELQGEARRMLHGMPAVRSCYGLVVVCMLILCETE